MTQLVLPIFPEGSSLITAALAFEKQDNMIYYFHGSIPIFSHPVDDIKSFRMFTSQLIVNGVCKQVDIINAFGVPPISVKRSTKLYREEGAEGFYKTRKKIRKPRVMTPEVITEAQSLLDDGLSRSEVANSLQIRKDTLAKAIVSGKLLEGRSVKKKQK